MIEWNEAQPGFNVFDLAETEQNVRCQFSKKHVVYAGAHAGCGCGFQHGEQKIPRKARIDFAGLIPSAFSWRPRFRGYSAPSQLENCAKVLETLEERCQSGLMGRFAKPTCPVCTR